MAIVIKSEEFYVNNSESNFDKYLEEAESYLCELKSTQIRLGLHVLGQQPNEKDTLELFLSISRAPTLEHQGLTQWIASRLGLDFDPWCDDEKTKLTKKDINLLKGYSLESISKFSDLIYILELISILFSKYCQ